MKTRSIVSAIVAAALSVVLCVGLLVGTTVAWFTDTVRGLIDVERRRQVRVTAASPSTCA